MAIRSLLISLFLPFLLASSGAWAQNPVGTCPAGVSSAFPGCYPFIQGGALAPTDGVPVVQAGANPLSRIASVSQLLAAVGTDLPSLNVVGNATIGGTLGVTGAATVGQGSANFWTVTGNSGSPLISATGTGNLFAQLKGAGTFGGLLQTANGNVLLTSDAGNGATVNYLKVTADIAGNPIQIAANDNTGGIRFLSPTQINYNFTYAGTFAGNTNHPFLLTSSIAGASQNTSQYSINQVTLNPSLKTGESMTGFAISDTEQSGFFGVDNPFLIQLSQAAAPTPPPVWATSTGYAPTNPLIYNGTGEYQLNSASACTSSSTPGGPTGGGTSIADGTCNWRFITDIAQSYYVNPIGSQTNLTFNAGGTSGGAVGFAFGGASGATLSGGATHYSELVGWETDSFNTLSSGNPLRQVIHQFVKTGNGAAQDWGISISGASYDAAIFTTAVMPNGVGIEFADQNLGFLQTMAGAFDCLMCVTSGANTTAGYLVTGGGGYIVRGPNAQLLGTGDLQLGSAGFHISSQALTIDTTYELLASVGATSGGTLWTTGLLAVDDFGNVATVTASAGVPTSVSLTCGSNPCPKTYVAVGSVPGGAVTWHPTNANSAILDTAGNASIPTTFTTASETYTAGTTLDFGTTSATVLALGNSGSVTTINGTIKAGSSTGLSCTGTPTSSFASVNGIVTHC